MQVCKFIELVGMPLDNFAPISVVKKAPPWYYEKKLLEYKPLAPDTEFEDAYKAQLSAVDFMKVINRLLYLSHQKEPVLVCYDEWQCQVLINWIKDNGFECSRYQRKVD